MQQRCAASLDSFAHARDLVAAEIVADHDVTWPQRGAKHLLDVGEESRAVDRAIEHQRCDQPVVPQAAQERGGMPVSMRYGRDQPLTARCAAERARHVCRGPSLVEEAQPGGVELGLQRRPFASRLGNVLAVLLGRAEALFLSVRPNLANVCHITGWLTVTPCSRATQARNSAIVASASSATRVASSAPAAT